MLKKIKHYFREEIWNFSIQKKKGLDFLYYKTLRIAYLSLRGFFFDHPCNVTASALTFFTLMTLVPLFALATFVAKELGFNISLQLLVHFPNQPQALEGIFSFADAYLAQIQGEIVAGLGIALLVLSVIFMLRNFELILNQIWNVKIDRSWIRALGDYLLLLFVFPVFFIVANSVLIYVISFLNYTFLIHLIPYLIFWSIFTFLYAFMPNTRVKLRSASLGAFLAAALYLIVQWLYLFFQRGVGEYGMVYGAMAALPLFLIWLLLSWYLILFGAEVAHAHQFFVNFEFGNKLQNVSLRFRKLLYLWMTHLGLKKGILTLDLLVEIYKIPRPLSKMVLQELVRCHIFQERKDGFKVAPNVSEMRISEILEKIESEGESDFDIVPTRSLEKFHEALGAFSKIVESSPENLKIKDVSDPV